MNIAKPKGEKQNMSFNEQHAGSKIFVRNVSEEATYEDFQVRLFIKDLDFDLRYGSFYCFVHLFQLCVIILKSRLLQDKICSID